MSVDSWTAVIATWVSVLTLVMAVSSLISRAIRHRIQVALKDVQDRLTYTETSLAETKRRHATILVYARRLYDMMNRSQMNPPEPPAEFYES